MIRPTSRVSQRRLSVRLVFGHQRPGAAAFFVGREVMVCNRCKKPLQGIGFVAYSRHRDDPADYKHVLCHDCNPAYEQEKARWEDAHPIPFAEPMTREEKRAVIQTWADQCYHHMRDWLSSSLPA